MSGVVSREAKRQARVLKGFRDYLPDQMILRQRIIGIFRDIFELHGFEPLDTPALEYLDVLTGKAGENEKLMYRFEDAGGREVGLRYDLTVPLARVVAQFQAEAAEMPHPAGLEVVGSTGRAGREHAEQVVS